MKRQFSAGGVVFKKDGDAIFWLIMKPKPSAEFPSNRYQLPKGTIETGEKVIDAATREVFEETAIRAKIIEKIDNIKYIYTFRGEKYFKVVTWFLMEYVSGEPTADNVETEEVFWMDFQNSIKTLSYSSEKEILKKANNIFGGNM